MYKYQAAAFPPVVEYCRHAKKTKHNLTIRLPACMG